MQILRTPASDTTSAVSLSGSEGSEIHFIDQSSRICQSGNSQSGCFFRGGSEMVSGGRSQVQSLLIRIRPQRTLLQSPAFLVGRCKILALARQFGLVVRQQAPLSGVQQRRTFQEDFRGGRPLRSGTLCRLFLYAASSPES